MRLSACLTINDRAADASAKVAASFRLPGNRPDEMVVVLDRPTEDAERGAVESYGDLPWDVRFAVIDGPGGWLCPARAWNVAYQTATGDLLYCISSDVVQDAGNVDAAREICAAGDTVLFGACHNVGADDPPGELYVGCLLPRPIGFITCMPSAVVQAIGGNDEEFMDGLWYEDADLSYRLWRQGLDFVFDDGVHGNHLHHERPALDADAGKAKREKNAALMLRKYGMLTPWWLAEQMVFTYETPAGRPSRLRWSHP